MTLLSTGNSLVILGVVGTEVVVDVWVVGVNPVVLLLLFGDDEDDKLSLLAIK